MDTTIGSTTTQPTTTKEWEWIGHACECGGTDEVPSDRVASLVDDEVLNLYDDMRVALNVVFDECYPDPTPENEEEYFDRHVEWVDGFEDASFDDESGNPGVVRLVKDGDRYVLSARDADGGYGDRRRATRLDPTLPDEEIRRQVCEFLRAQDPCGDVTSRNAPGKGM
jgi:hypothetical protein